MHLRTLYDIHVERRYWPPEVLGTAGSTRSNRKRCEGPTRMDDCQLFGMRDPQAPNAQCTPNGGSQS